MYFLFLFPKCAEAVAAGCRSWLNTNWSIYHHKLT